MTVEAAGAYGGHRGTGITMKSGRPILHLLCLIFAASGLARGDDDAALPTTVVAGDVPLLIEGSGDVVLEGLGNGIDGSSLGGSILGGCPPEAVPIDLPEAAVAAGMVTDPLPDAWEGATKERAYVTFDVLFLERDNGVINQPLVTEGPLMPARVESSSPPAASCRPRPRACGCSSAGTAATRSAGSSATGDATVSSVTRGPISRLDHRPGAGWRCRVNSARRSPAGTGPAPSAPRGRHRST